MNTNIPKWEPAPSTVFIFMEIKWNKNSNWKTKRCKMKFDYSVSWVHLSCYIISPYRGKCSINPTSKNSNYLLLPVVWNNFWLCSNILSYSALVPQVLNWSGSSIELTVHMYKYFRNWFKVLWNNPMDCRPST